MTEHEDDSADQMRGAATIETAASPEAYERANYIGNICFDTSDFLGSHPVALRNE